MGICRSKPTSGPVAAERATSQERPQTGVESRMRSSQSDMESGEDVASSRRRGEEAPQERPRPPAKSSTPLSLKRDINSVGNGHGVISQEQLQPVALSRLRSSQRGVISSEGDAGGSSAVGHRAEGTSQERPHPAVRSPTPSSQKSDIKPVGNGHRREVTLQEQLQPVVVARTRSSQRSAINSEGDAGGSSGNRGEVTSQERPQPLLSRIRSQRSDIKTEGNTVASSGHRGEEASQERPRPVGEAPTLSSQKSYLSSGGNTGGSSDHRGGNNHCITPTKLWLTYPMATTK
ncbi:hypothetical protein V8E53_005902 [Lactarius tabidus]